MDWSGLKARAKLDHRGAIIIGVDGDKQDITDIVIPDGVEEIADSALAHCYHLKSVSLPLGLRIIGKCAFMKCWSLENIVIPNELEEIGDLAFHGCELNNVETHIHIIDFSCVDGLENLYVPNTTIYVPAELSKIYKQHPLFSKLTIIEEMLYIK